MGDEEFQEMQHIVEMEGLLPSDLYVQLFRAFRDRRQKTFGFLNRLCLLISNPLPPLSLTDSLDFS